MNLLLLFIAILSLMFVIRKIDSIEKTENYSFMQEAKQNTYTLLWGTILITLMLFIPYCIWILTGSLTHWGGFYIIATAVIGTILFIYAYYFKIKSKSN